MVTTIVDATRISVVIRALLADAGHLVTVDGHAVTAAVRVVNTMDMLTLG